MIQPRAAFPYSRPRCSFGHVYGVLVDKQQPNAERPTAKPILENHGRCLGAPENRNHSLLIPFIQDQSTLQGLLERLRSSAAYANTLAGTQASEHANPSGSPPLPPAPSSHEPQSHATLDAQTDSSGVSIRISSLLSRLRPTTQGPDVELPVSRVPEIKTIDNASENMAVDSISDNESLGIAQHVPKVDYRSLTYVESLSRVEELLKDPRAADALLEVSFKAWYLSFF